MVDHAAVKHNNMLTVTGCDRSRMCNRMSLEVSKLLLVWTLCRALAKLESVHMYKATPEMRILPIIK